jgi:hypothetical protein
MLAVYLLWRGATTRQLMVMGISYKTAFKMAKDIRERLEFPTLRKRHVSTLRIQREIQRLTTRVFEGPQMRKHLTRVFYDLEVHAWS